MNRFSANKAFGKNIFFQVSYFTFPCRYVPPLKHTGGKPMNVSIGFDNFEILKIDDRDFTVEINAYLIVKWKDSRIAISFAQVK